MQLKHEQRVVTYDDKNESIEFSTFYCNLWGQYRTFAFRVRIWDGGGLDLLPCGRAC